MKNRKKQGEILDTKNYLSKFAGIDIIKVVPRKHKRKHKNRTIVLDEWVRLDFPDMGVVSYSKLDPP